MADVNYLYNPSDGLLVDVLEEVATQKVAELGVKFADALLEVGFAAFGRVSTLSAAEQEEIRDRVSAFIQDTSLSSYEFTIDGTTYTTADLVHDFRDRVLTELGQGTEVVLVAHSQGNFFANETYTAVRAAAPPAVSQGLAVVNVANATLDTPSGLWITTHQDRIIWPLRYYNLAMNSNFDAEGSYAFDLTGHGFAEIYLKTQLPTGRTTEADSIAGHVMALLQQALDIAQTPAGIIQGSTWSSLFTLNVATGETTVLGRFVYTDTATIPAVWDIAVNPRGGPVYAISPNAVSSFTDSPTLFRLPQSTIGGNALAFNAEGELFSMYGNSVYRVDTSSGVVTALPISLGDYVSSGDLTFDSNGILFGTAIGPDGYDHLIRIDVDRSTLDFIGPIGYREVYGLYFSGGYLFGITGGGTVITIDTATGEGRTEWQLPIDDVTGLQ